MHYGALLLLFVYISFANSTESPKAGGILPFLKDTVEYVKETWNTISPLLEEIRDLPFPNNRDNVENIFQHRFSDLSIRVEHMDRVVQSMASATNFNLKKDLPSQVRLELRIDTLLELISIINSADDTYKEIIGFGYLENVTQPKYERHTIENFATYVVSHAPSSVQGAMDRLHGMIYPDPSDSNFFLHQNVLELIAKVLKTGDGSMCQTKQSPNQIIYSLFNSLQMTQLKGFTMMQFSWMLLRLYNKGNFTIESRRMRERYLSRIVEQGKSLSEALKLADTSYWRCDPKQHEEGETYLQLTRLIQGFVINEVDLSHDRECFKDCPYYERAKQQRCYKNFCASQRSCAGDVMDCQYIYKSMTICQADPLTSKRRYEWIDYWDGHKIGNTELPCHKKSSAESWSRWIFWKCSYCFCLCDDTYNSDRYFSLRHVLSSTEQNKVITGIRFVQMNGIIHMQIQEGELELHGRINQSSTAWQPVDNFTLKGADEGHDYMKMSYYKRAIDLDDLTAPPGHVITGVRFRMVHSHLNLEIRANPFNFTSGELLQPGTKNIWLGNHNSENARTKLSMGSPDTPLNTIFPSNIDSKSNQYLLFTHSDISADAAQTTVPFLDAQEVAPQPPVPLAGVGVYHKGQRGFGGFVGLKVFTFNIGSNVKHEIAALFDNHIKN